MNVENLVNADRVADQSKDGDIREKEIEVEEAARRELGGYKQAGTDTEFDTSFRPLAPSNDFEWPDDRKEVEGRISELRERQVLFVKGFLSVWWNWAPQRIASVLQASLNRLWPECAGVRVGAAGDIGLGTGYGFWRHVGRQASPVIICVPTSEADGYIRNLLQAGWDTSMRMLEELKDRNIYLMIPVKEEEPYKSLKQKDRSLNHNSLSYAYWEVPVTQLELEKLRPDEAGRIYKTLVARFENELVNSKTVYYIIHEGGTLSEEALLAKVGDEVTMDNREHALMERAMSDESQLMLRVLYVATFFPDSPAADFDQVIRVLLSGVLVSKQHPEGHFERPVLEEWANPVRQFKVMRECTVGVTELGNGVTAVGFRGNISNVKMIAAFLHRTYYPAFFILTKELVESNLLFSQISNPLYKSLTRAIALLIRGNPSTYDGKWLFYKAAGLASKVDEAIPDKQLRKAIEESLDINLFKKSLEPLSGLLRELLLFDIEHLKSNVRQFFSALIDSKIEKEAVLELAIDLYNDLLDTENFPEEQLDSYFMRSLEESSREGKFQAYNVLRKNFKPFNLLRKTAAWLEDNKVHKKSNTAMFSWLYKIDYLIMSFRSYALMNDDLKKYELLTSSIPDELISDMGIFIHEISSAQCQESWNLLMRRNNGIVERFRYLEMSLTDIYIILDDDDVACLTTQSLVAEVVSGWFYILSTVPVLAGSSGDVKKMFISTVSKNAAAGTWPLLIAAWKYKANKIYTDNIIWYKELLGDGADSKNIVSTLKKRRGILEDLIYSSNQNFNI